MHISAVNRLTQYHNLFNPSTVDALESSILDTIENKKFAISVNSYSHEPIKGSDFKFFLFNQTPQTDEHTFTGISIFQKVKGSDMSLTEIDLWLEGKKSKGVIISPRDITSIRETGVVYTQLANTHLTRKENTRIYPSQFKWQFPRF